MSASPAPNLRAVPSRDTGLRPQPTAGAAKLRARHYGILLSFLALVVVPVVIAATYLFSRAADQYVSRVAFSVRSEEPVVPTDFLGSLSAISGTSSKDTDILFEFIHSQEIVARINEKIDLTTLFSRPNRDFVFAYRDGGSIEDLVNYWKRMVRIDYNSGAGILDVEARAFEPETAQSIVSLVIRESAEMINKLSAIAREDKTKFAKLDLERAEKRLKAARKAMTEFRSNAQTVDPSAEMGVQAQVLSGLTQKHTDALIELDLLADITSGRDVRVNQAKRKIAVIESRIQEERAKFSNSDKAGATQSFSDLVGEFENLTVDREFAEQDYLSALKTYELARAEALRQSRYLAAHVNPTLAEKPIHPRRFLITGLVAAFAVLFWSMCVLIFYALRDRR